MAFTLPADGGRLRLVSYLSTNDTKYVIGCVPMYGTNRIEGYRTVLRPAANINDDTATFILRTDPLGFRLYWAQDPKWFLTWINTRINLYLNWADNYLDHTYSIFTVDSVKDGNWFALNNYNHQWVVDVDHSGTADNTKVISWEWNGGDNQIWRPESA
jgi:hypothetical protein